MLHIKPYAIDFDSQPHVDMFVQMACLIYMRHSELFFWWIAHDCSYENVCVSALTWSI